MINGIMKVCLSSEIQALGTVATLLGISGKDLKSLNIKKRYEKIVKYFLGTLGQETITEKKEEIISDSLKVIGDYLKTSSEFDNKTFDNMLKLTVNGIKVEDELTKEYLKILKRLTFLDLKTFEVLFKEPILKEYKCEDKYGHSRKSVYDVIYYEREKIDIKNELKEIPIQLLENSLKGLIKNKLLHSQLSGQCINEPLKEKKMVIELIYLTDLGKKIMELLK